MFVLNNLRRKCRNGTLTQNDFLVSIINFKKWLQFQSVQFRHSPGNDSSPFPFHYPATSFSKDRKESSEKKFVKVGENFRRKKSGRQVRFRVLGNSGFRNYKMELIKTLAPVRWLSWLRLPFILSKLTKPVISSFPFA